MSDQQSSKVTIKSVIQRLLATSTLKAMPKTLIYEYQQLVKTLSFHHEILKVIKKKISNEDEVEVRIKGLTLIHLLLSAKISHETNLELQTCFDQIQDRLRKKNDPKVLTTLEKYFIKEVEGPYLNFLKKLNFWLIIRNSSLECDPVNIGFSQLNKIKEILQLRTILQHYSCYYPDHQYAFNLYFACLISIKGIWRSVCLKIKKITLVSLEQLNIQERQFMLIKEAEVTQQSLIEFVYGDKFVLKLPKELRLHQINLLKPEVNQLQNERRRKKSAEVTLGIIENKKLRKASMGTMESQRSGSISSPKDGITESELTLDNNLNTQQQMELLDNIKELQEMLQYTY